MTLSRSDFTKGRKFKVIKPGASLSGMKPCGPSAQQGWAMSLPVGAVLTCAGTSMTFGDGVPMIKWLDENGQWLANDCEFEPSTGGMWNALPDVSFLEEYFPDRPDAVKQREAQARGESA